MPRFRAAVKTSRKSLRIQLSKPPRARDDRGSRFAAKGLLSLVSLAISGLGVQRTHRWLTNLSAPVCRVRSGSYDPKQALQLADRWRELLETEAATLPLRAECSEISLTLHGLLRLAGHQGQVVIGHRSTGEQIQGHTWMTLDGKVVSELGEPEEAYPLLNVRLT